MRRNGAPKRGEPWAFDYSARFLQQQLQLIQQNVTFDDARDQLFLKLHVPDFDAIVRHYTVLKDIYFVNPGRNAYWEESAAIPLLYEGLREDDTQTKSLTACVAGAQQRWTCIAFNIYDQLEFVSQAKPDENMCLHCWRVASALPTKRLLACDKCQYIGYCDVQCKRQDAARHAPLCRMNCIKQSQKPKSKGTNATKLQKQESKVINATKPKKKKNAKSQNPRELKTHQDEKNTPTEILLPEPNETHLETNDIFLEMFLRIHNTHSMGTVFLDLRNQIENALDKQLGLRVERERILQHQRQNGPCSQGTYLVVTCGNNAFFVLLSNPDRWIIGDEYMRYVNICTHVQDITDTFNALIHDGKVQKKKQCLEYLASQHPCGFVCEQAIGVCGCLEEYYEPIFEGEVD